MEAHHLRLHVLDDGANGFAKRREIDARRRCRGIDAQLRIIAR